MVWVVDQLERYRNPAYTGENRCIPCTAVNSVIGLLLSVAAAGVGIAAGSATIGAVAGLVVLLVSAASIYLKGYLVPGTPTLTKRYFPERVLAAFDKAETPATTDRESIEEIDIEQYLVEAGTLEPCQNGADLCLTDEFRRSWDEQIETVRESDVGRDRLLSVLDISAEEVTFEDHGEAFRAKIDGQYVGTWESRAAFLADIAAADLLAEWVDDWNALTVGVRGQLLNGLRLFLITCPECGGELAFGTDTVESCCTTREVAAVSCDACETRVFESDAVA